MIPQPFIDEVLDKTNIVSVLQQYISLTKKGNNHWACCPFHHENTPSFSVNEAKQFYYCFGCGQTGNVISFLMNHKHQSFPEVIEELAGHVGLSMPEQSKQSAEQESKQKGYYDLLQFAAREYEQELKHAPQAIDYLKRRGLTGQIAKRYHMGYAPDQWDFLSKRLQNKVEDSCHLGLAIKHSSGRVYDRFRNRITFPVRDHRGRVVAFGGRVLGQEEPKYLNSPESSVFHKKEVAYGLYEALQQNNNKLPEVMIVEGYMDVISLAQFGYDRAVACMGTALSSKHIQLLKRYTKKLIFCFDGDNAGRTAAYRTLETVIPLIEPELEFKFIFLPNNEDPDTFVRHNGIDAWQQHIREAHSFEDTLIRYLSDNYPNNTVQERSRLVDKAKEILGKINHQAMVRLLVDRLSLVCKIPSEQLQAMLIGKADFTPPKQNIAMPKNMWHKAVAYLLHAPQVTQQINDTSWLSLSKREGAAHLQKLISIAQSLTVPGTQQFIEQIKNENFFKVYLRILNWDPMLSEKQIETEFLNCFQQLERSVTQERINELLELSKTKGLSNDEKMELSHRIKDQKEHKLPTSSTTLEHEN